MRERDALEALAVLLGSRREAKRLLGATTLRHLADAPIVELERFVPPSAARRLWAALSLARSVLAPPRRDALDTPAAAYAHLFPYLAGREAERFLAVACDSRYQPLATTVVADGCPDSVEIRPADVFAVALRHRAVWLIVGHNHPSNDPTPSSEDYALTERLVDVGKLLGIPVLDHLVVAGDGYWSLLCGDRATRATEAARSDAAY